MKIINNEMNKNILGLILSRAKDADRPIGDFLTTGKPPLLLLLLALPVPKPIGKFSRAANES